MKRSLFMLSRLSWLLWSLATLHFMGVATADDLIFARPGELPIILTAPHGGRQGVPACDPRTPVGARFVNRMDYNTEVLALGIAAELERLTGKRPYLVVAGFHRRFIDANRPAGEAYGSPACAADYEFYHATIRRYVDEVRAKYPRAMLFDIHGQAAYPDSILRGTRYGTTVKALLASAGAPALTGPDSVFGRLAAMGYDIVPPNNNPPTDKVEAKGYTGGYTVALYGSSRAGGIDAMQLEFGRDLREKGIIDQTAKDAAKAIAAFYQHYLSH